MDITFKTMRMRSFFILLFCVLGSKSFSQQDLFIKSALVSIDENYVLELKDLDKGKNYYFKFYDIQPLGVHREKIFAFIEKVLEDTFYVNPEVQFENDVTGWILYNCRTIKGITPNSEIPCSSGSPLNIELLKKGYYKYVGDDEFLKKITPNNEVPD